VSFQASDHDASLSTSTTALVTSWLRIPLVVISYESYIL
jgi:hypothetical protein